MPRATPVRKRLLYDLFEIYRLIVQNPLRVSSTINVFQRFLPVFWGFFLKVAVKLHKILDSTSLFSPTTDLFSPNWAEINKVLNQHSGTIWQEPKSLGEVTPIVWAIEDTTLFFWGGGDFLSGLRFWRSTYWTDWDFLVDFGGAQIFRVEFLRSHSLMTVSIFPWLIYVFKALF